MYGAFLDMGNPEQLMQVFNTKPVVRERDAYLYLNTQVSSPGNTF